MPPLGHLPVCPPSCAQVEDVKQTEQRIKFAEVEFPPHVSPACRGFIQQVRDRPGACSAPARRTSQHAMLGPCMLLPLRHPTCHACCRRSPSVPRAGHRQRSCSSTPGSRTATGSCAASSPSQPLPDWQLPSHPVWPSCRQRQRCRQHPSCSRQSFAARPASRPPQARACRMGRRQRAAPAPTAPRPRPWQQRWRRSCRCRRPRWHTRWVGQWWAAGCLPASLAVGRAFAGLCCQLFDNHFPAQHAVRGRCGCWRPAGLQAHGRPARGGVSPTPWRASQRSQRWQQRIQQPRPARQRRPRRLGQPLQHPLPRRSQQPPRRRA